MKSLLIISSLSILSCGCHSTADVSPHEAFCLFADVPSSETIPNCVTNLQADGALWMDFHVCCRFTASPEIIDEIIESGYEKTEWESIKSDMLTEVYTERFSPKWDPAGAADKECYVKRRLKDKSSDTLRLVVSRSTGVVYAVGEGRPE